MPASPILVTGAAEFIGYHVAHRLLREGRTVVGRDNYHCRWHRPVHPMVPGLSSPEHANRWPLSPARRSWEASGYHFSVMGRVAVAAPVDTAGLLRRPGRPRTLRGLTPASTDVRKLRDRAAERRPRIGQQRKRESHADQTARHHLVRLPRLRQDDAPQPRAPQPRGDADRRHRQRHVRGEHRRRARALRGPRGAASRRNPGRDDQRLHLLHPPRRPPDRGAPPRRRRPLRLPARRVRPASPSRCPSPPPSTSATPPASASPTSPGSTRC